MNFTLFDTPEAGDILFVDSSHVVKAGSDCQLLFSDILPRLNPGTLIHFHDVSDRFEYPAENQQEAYKKWADAGSGIRETEEVRVRCLKIN